MLLKVDVKGLSLEFETSVRCFSPRKIDAGTLAMLSIVEFNKGQKVLDLGCGYGVVGIIAAKLIDAGCVYMVDCDPEALFYASHNAIRNLVGEIHINRSDGIETFNVSGFDLILCNPPYHVDFSLPKRFINAGFNKLVTGGKMLMVTKRREWYKNKFISVFGGVRIHEINGYYVFEGEKE